MAALGYLEGHGAGSSEEIIGDIEARPKMFLLVHS